MMQWACTAYYCRIRLSTSNGGAAAAFHILPHSPNSFIPQQISTLHLSDEQSKYEPSQRNFLTASQHHSTMWEPFGNTTVLRPTQWHPEPQFRGTFSILSSCLITMSLCIWTSLHLNVPEYGKEHLQKYRKAAWMVLGLLAPELVVWNAWEQRKKVKELNALMRRRVFMPKESTARERISGWSNKTWQSIRAPFSPKAEESQELVDLTQTGVRDKKLHTWPDIHGWRVTMSGMAAQVLFSPGTEDRQNLADVISSRMHNKHLNAWTDVHSWLVVMGGVAFEDKSPEDQQFMPGTRQRIPITLWLFRWMVKARPHLIPDISRGYIEDKSKSDWLAKGLTCWQAGYFCIQCTFRLSQSLSITLLELNVFAHAICALLLFLVWWDKPRDILVPTTISSEEALQICAGHLDSRVRAVDAEGAKHLINFQPIPEHLPPDKCFEIVQPTTIIAHKYAGSVFLQTFADGTHYKFLKVRGTYWRLACERESPNVYVDLDTELGHSSEIDVVLTSRDISHLVRAYEYCTEVWATNPAASPLVNLMAPRLGYRKSNWSLSTDHFGIMLEIEELSDHVRTFAGITLASSLYGGLHLIAWASAFHSHAALVLWRAASVTILATGPFCIATGALFAGFEWLFPNVIPGRDSLAEILFWFPMCLSGLFVVWYILCRTFIVVECFILLAHIPESALRVPTWAAYIPSFG